MYRLFLLFTALFLGASYPALAQDTLQPLIRVNPEYPVGARSQGIEGSVTVEFTVDAFGTIEDARVTESSPVGVFDQSALAAVQRWRYSAEAGRQATILSEQLNFSLSDVVWQLADNSSPATITPQNDCVRENVSYDYGEMVEAGLINTCTDPLLVFGCALGTAEYTGQWVCIDSERLKTVLLRPGDGRIGSPAFVTTAAGNRSFSYGENIFVARAPNTQYWWIACREADEPCRDSARQWVRSVDRQLANVNPQGRASVAVARSR